VVGTTVGITANAFDLDATTNTITYSLTSNPGGLFQIDINTGVVTTAAAIDREAIGATRSITVRATSSDGSMAEETFSIAINDVDEFDVTVPTDTDATANNVTENVAVGTTIGITANAFDLDATTNTITYSLTSNPGGLFQIDANTGVVTTAAAIDREVVGATRSITVRATSSDGSAAEQTFSIAINDVDEFDLGIVGDADIAKNAVNENAPAGTVVGIRALAVDADATTNNVTYTLVDNAGGRFAIDAATGVVTVASSSLLDFESMTSHSILIRALSTDGSESFATYSIEVLNVNERPLAQGEFYQTDFVTPVVIPFSRILANASDPEGDVLRPELISSPTYGKLTVDPNAAWSYQPEANFVGVVTIVYAVTDGSLFSESQTIQILVLPPFTTVIAPPESRDSPAGASGQSSSTSISKDFFAGAAVLDPLIGLKRDQERDLVQEIVSNIESSATMLSDTDRSRTKVDVYSKSTAETAIQDSNLLVVRQFANVDGVQRLRLEDIARVGLVTEQAIGKQFVPQEQRDSLENRKEQFVYQTAAPVVVGTMLGVGVSLHVLASASVGGTLLSQSRIFTPLDPLTVLEGSSKVKKSRTQEDLLFDAVSMKNHGVNHEAN